MKLGEHTTKKNTGSLCEAQKNHRFPTDQQIFVKNTARWWKLPRSAGKRRLRERDLCRSPGFSTPAGLCWSPFVDKNAVKSMRIASNLKIMTQFCGHLALYPCPYFARNVWLSRPSGFESPHLADCWSSQPLGCDAGLLTNVFGQHSWCPKNINTLHHQMRDFVIRFITSGVWPIYTKLTQMEWRLPQGHTLNWSRSGVSWDPAGSTTNFRKGKMIDHDILEVYIFSRKSSWAKSLRVPLEININCVKTVE